MKENKNLTITLSLEEHKLLDELVEHFQKKSISTISKSDLIRYLLIDYNKLIEIMKDDEELVRLEREIRKLVIKDKQ